MVSDPDGNKATFTAHAQGNRLENIVGKNDPNSPCGDGHFVGLATLKGKLLFGHADGSMKVCGGISVNWHLDRVSGMNAPK